VNKFILIFFLFIFGYGSIINDFKNSKYNKICILNNITNTTNEKLLSIIGISCVKADRLYLIPYILPKLKFSKVARENAIYLATIYMQKRLLYSYLFDNLSLEGFNLPKTDYIISIIFSKIKNHDYRKDGNVIIITLKNETIKVYPKDTRMYVDEYKNNKLIKRRWFK